MDPGKATIGTTLITGATGFVGSHLARSFSRSGWTVHLIVRPARRPDVTGVSVHEHDGTTDQMCDILAKVRPDLVIHVAAFGSSSHSPGDITPLLKANIEFGTQLLEAMHFAQCRRFINTGTHWQHYADAAYSPVSLYAASKQAFRAILRYYTEALGFSAITLELFDTFGPDDPRPKVFSLLRNAAQNGVPLDMTGGEQLVDLVYIDDVVNAYRLCTDQLLALPSGTDSTFAVSSGAPRRLREVVELYCSVTGIKPRINWGAKPYREREPMRPWSGGIPIPGWSPHVDLAEGFRRMGAQA